MDPISSFYEKVAVGLKPIGNVLVVMAVTSFVAMFFLPYYLSLSGTFVAALITMWVFGLALIYMLYCPGAANLLLKQPIEKSAMAEQSREKRLLAAIGFTLWFGGLIYLSFRIPIELFADHAKTISTMLPNGLIFV